MALSAQATAEELHFNEFFVNKANAPLDLKYFERGSSVQPGTYNVDIYLNQALIKRQNIDFVLKPDSDKVTPVIKIKLLEELGVDISRMQRDGLLTENVDKSEVVDLPRLVNGASVEFEVTNLALEISMPQMYAKSQLHGYVDNSLWDRGLTAYYTDYQLNYSQNDSSGSRSNYGYLGLRNGFNFQGWRLRNESAWTSSTDNKSNFRSIRNYAEHDISFIKGKFAIGELYSQGDIFESVRFRGIQISSDVGMLSDNEISYAPVVRGIAETYATVEVRQNGYVIYSTSVSPGAFEITDIFPSGSSGDLTIKIIEADGQEREYSQPYSYLPVMTRQGSFRYSLVTGKYAYEDQAAPKFFQSTAVYGLSDNLTSYGGLLMSTNYKASNVGLGVNSELGGFSFDITNSQSQAIPNKTDHGQSTRFLYSKTFNATDTSFTMIGHRYSTSGYRTLAQHADDITYLNYQSSSRQKSRIDINIYQSLGQFGSMFAMVGEANYWNQRGKAVNWQLGYSGSLSGASYSLAYARSESSGQPKSDSQFTASLSIPLGGTARSHRVYANAITTQNGDSSLQSGISGYLNERNTLSYSAQTRHSKQGGSSNSVGLSWDSSNARFNGNYSQSRDDKHLDLGAGGSLIVHRDGITFGQPVGETFALIEVPDVAGVGVDSSASIRTDRKGYAVIPYVQPYRLNWINLDTTTLDSHTELTDNARVLIPTRGAIVKASYASKQGRRVQFELTTDSGEPIPFGATANDAQGKTLGIVDNLSRLLVFATENQGILDLSWNSGACRAEYQLPAAQSKRAYERVKLTCRTTHK
ncbi:fimbria/pilus outer membrane usher protein [Pseudomonas taiwanensis]|uniref:fimbria/pilus outer membrane usher protein n=1 Tax=Pseudomonas taiwanensis TaxID=470150 RepID=UPI0028DF75C4|nr:fimbria/pilus outer membrane usher protein [Pseudomonas taiwanensis]MDT8921773.1 fimbria/pilus outer membrane usher protein [Pseudomonas taiwanensis]